MTCDAMEPSREGTVPVYKPTIIDSRLLLRRLATELSFAAYRAGQAWSECRKAPVSFGIQLKAARVVERQSVFG